MADRMGNLNLRNFLLRQSRMVNFIRSLGVGHRAFKVRGASRYRIYRESYNSSLTRLDR